MESLTEAVQDMSLVLNLPPLPDKLLEERKDLYHRLGSRSILTVPKETLSMRIEETRSLIKRLRRRSEASSGSHKDGVKAKGFNDLLLFRQDLTQAQSAGMPHVLGSSVTLKSQRRFCRSADRYLDGVYTLIKSVDKMSTEGIRHVLWNPKREGFFPKTPNADTRSVRRALFRERSPFLRTLLKIWKH